MQLDFIDPDIYDTSILETFRRREAATELSAENCSFLAGLIRRYRPATLLEVGVSAGGSSALILHILDKLGLGSELVSVDLNDRWYRDTSRLTGWAARELYPDREDWRLITGKYLPEVIEGLDREFDFCFLDTVHSLPGELLDYLVILPFMREGGIMAMHDTVLYFLNNNTRAVATRVLFDACVGRKIIPPQHSPHDANLSAFQITPDTYAHVANVFFALCMPWAYRLDEAQLGLYHVFFRKYYGEQAADWFVMAANLNKCEYRGAALAGKERERQVLKLLRSRVARG